MDVFQEEGGGDAAEGDEEEEEEEDEDSEEALAEEDYRRYSLRKRNMVDRYCSYLQQKPVMHHMQHHACLSQQFSFSSTPW